MKFILATSYDVFGYLVPGIVGAAGLYLLAGLIAPMPAVNWASVSTIGWTALLFGCYLVGHFLHALLELLFRIAPSLRGEEIVLTKPGYIDPELLDAARQEISKLLSSSSKGTGGGKSYLNVLQLLSDEDSVLKRAEGLLAIQSAEAENPAQVKETATLLEMVKKVRHVHQSLVKGIGVLFMTRTSADTHVWQLGEALVQMRGKSEALDVYIYRQGLYRALAGASLLFTIVTAAHAALGQNLTLHFGPGEFVIGQALFGSLAFLSLLGMAGSWVRYCAFSAYRVRQCLCYLVAHPPNAGGA